MSGIITTLEVQKRNKERVNVYLDGEFTFGLALLEAAKLQRGQTLTDDEIAELQAIDSVHKALDQAVRFLAYRPRSIQEIRRNLAKKKVETSVIDQVITRLESLGYVDDLAFARFWTSNRDEFKPKGPLALRHELREKGISNTIIEQVLEAMDFADAAYRAAQHRVKLLKDAGRREFRKKMYEYLARRGFRSGTITDTINLLLEELELPEPDDIDK